MLGMNFGFWLCLDSNNEVSTIFLMMMKFLDGCKVHELFFFSITETLVHYFQQHANILSLCTF